MTEDDGIDDLPDPAGPSPEERRLTDLLKGARKDTDVGFSALDAIETEVRTVMAIRHLIRHGRLALGSNAEPEIDCALIRIEQRISMARSEANRDLPF